MHSISENLLWPLQLEASNEMIVRFVAMYSLSNRIYGMEMGYMYAVL